MLCALPRSKSDTIDCAGCRRGNLLLQRNQLLADPSPEAECPRTGAGEACHVSAACQYRKGMGPPRRVNIWPFCTSVAPHQVASLWFAVNFGSAYSVQLASHENGDIAGLSVFALSS